MTTFFQWLTESIENQGSHVCVGLDPDISKMPELKGTLPERLLEFSSAIVDATASHACIYKANFAFWLACEAENELAKLISFIQSDRCLPVILDAKFGDIGNTATKYAQAAFDRFGAAGLTVNAYLGPKTLQPYLDHGPGKAIFVLSHTSNPDAAVFQEDCYHKTSGEPLFVKVAREAVALRTDQTASVGLVMGATFPEQIGEFEQWIADWDPSVIPLLLPGVGKQEGDLKATIQLASPYPFVVNSSRDIIHASSGTDFASVAGERAKKLCEDINRTLGL